MGASVTRAKMSPKHLFLASLRVTLIDSWEEEARSDGWKRRFPSSFL